MGVVLGVMSRPLLVHFFFSRLSELPVMYSSLSLLRRFPLQLAVQTMPPLILDP